MAAAEDWLAARGVWKLNLLVREDNASVRRCYERLGYAETRSVCFQKAILPRAETGEPAQSVTS